MMNLTTIILAGTLVLNATSNSAIANGLVYSENEFINAKTQINSFDYTNTSFEENSKFAKNELYNYFDTHEGIAKKEYLDELYHLVRYDEFNDYRIGGNSLELKFDMVNTGGGGGTTLPISNNKFETLSYSLDNSSISYKSNLDAKIFIGIDLSRDAAVGIYNFLAEIINNYFDVSNIITLVRQSYTKFDIFVKNLTTSFAKLLAKFVAYIPSGIIGTLIKVALVALTIGAIIFFVSAFFAGMFGYGYYIGFLRNGLFDWTFILGLNK